LSADGHPGTPAPDPRRLAVELAALGVPARVEAEGAMAVLRLPPPAALPPADLRAAIVSAARASGFANVALELTDDPGRA
jgi:hypothetical protein